MKVLEMKRYKHTWRAVVETGHLWWKERWVVYADGPYWRTLGGARVHPSLSRSGYSDVLADAKERVLRREEAELFAQRAESWE